MRRLGRLFRSWTVLAVLVISAAVGPNLAFAQAGLLDGKTFITTEGDAGKPAEVVPRNRTVG